MDKDIQDFLIDKITDIGSLVEIAKVYCEYYSYGNMTVILENILSIEKEILNKLDKI